MIRDGAVNSSKCQCQPGHHGTTTNLARGTKNMLKTSSDSTTLRRFPCQWVPSQCRRVSQRLYFQASRLPQPTRTKNWNLKLPVHLPSPPPSQVVHKLSFHPSRLPQSVTVTRIRITVLPWKAWLAMPPNLTSSPLQYPRRSLG